MDFSTDILTNDERIIFNLRTLYSKCGYAPYKMSRFEEYELYAANKAFLPSGEIIAFYNTGGKLMALRPDVTLSIVKNLQDSEELKKLYYNENIYRTINGEIKEQVQVGLECIGKINAEQAGEVLMLAKKSLDALGEKTQLDISHMGFLGGLLESEGLNAKQRADMTQSISEKNIPEIRLLCEKFKLSNSFGEKLTALTSLCGSFAEVRGDLERISVNDTTSAALQELDELDSVLKRLGTISGINIDFSVTGDLTYYNGIVFQGFIEGIPEKVLSGGRYDELIRSFGKSMNAIGFALYPDLVSLRNTQSDEAASSSALKSSDPKSTSEKSPTSKMLGIALPKGRLGEKAYEIFKNIGFDCADMNGKSRKLVLENPKQGIRYFWVKPSDVAIYVERGVADIGVVGKDTLLEERRDVYELLDLGIGKCQMCVAAETGYSYDRHDKTLRVATKFPNISREYFTGRGYDIDIIKLQGSIELAPMLGLSDVIVDLVETGATLKENNMEPIETIVDISARLISNKTSYKFNQERIKKLCEELLC